MKAVLPLLISSGFSISQSFGSPDARHCKPGSLHGLTVVCVCVCVCVCVWVWVCVGGCVSVLA